MLENEDITKDDIEHLGRMDAQAERAYQREKCGCGHMRKDHINGKCKKCTCICWRQREPKYRWENGRKVKCI